MQKGIDSLGQIVSTKGVGSVTSVATNTGSGITGGTITSSGTIAADTSVLSTKANVTALLLGKLGLTGGSTLTTGSGGLFGTYAYRSSGLAELTGATFSDNISITKTTSNPTLNLTNSSSGSFPIIQSIDNRTGGNNWNVEFGRTIGNFSIYDATRSTEVFSIAKTSGAALFSSNVTASGINTSGGASFTGGSLPSTSGSTLSYAYSSANHDFAFGDGTGYSYRLAKRVGGVTTPLFTLQDNGIATISSRLNVNGATDNSLFSLNNGGGTTYTNGFSPNASNYTGAITLGGGTTYVYTGSGAVTWTLPNPSGNNQIYIIKNNGSGVITLNAYSAGQLIPISSTTGVSSITISVGGTVTIQQDGSSKSYVMNVGSESGTYTPTSSGEVNCNTVTFETFKYSRVGNECHVSGQVTLTRTAASTYFEISLPIPTTISSSSDATGVITSSSYQASGYVKGSGSAVGINTNSASSSGSQSFIMEFTYIIK